MRKIREVLRLSGGGLSKRKIAASLGVSLTAAGDCIRRARQAGLGRSRRAQRAAARPIEIHPLDDPGTLPEPARDAFRRLAAAVLASNPTPVPYAAIHLLSLPRRHLAL